MRIKTSLRLAGAERGKLTFFCRVKVVSVPDWDHEETGGHPGRRYGDLGICDGPVTQRGHGEHHRHEPVSSHEDEGVDGDVGGDVDDVLDCPAPGQTEGPEHQDVVTRCGRDTDLAN